MMLEEAARKADPERSYARGCLESSNGIAAARTFQENYPEFRHDVKCWIHRLLRAKAGGKSFGDGFRVVFPFLDRVSIDIFMTALRFDRRSLIARLGG